MDCPRCGTPNMTVARFCRRCGETMPERDVWVLGARSSGSRLVVAAKLREGHIVPGSVFSQDVSLELIVEAVLEAVRHHDAKGAIKLTSGSGSRYEAVIEGADIIARFRVDSPYVRMELRGQRGSVRQVIRRVVARHGEEMFTADDGRWDRFLERTGIDQAENRSTLLELLS